MIKRADVESFKMKAYDPVLPEGAVGARESQPGTGRSGCCVLLIATSDPKRSGLFVLHRIRRVNLPDHELAGFLEFWQTRRDGEKRGIVEITS